MCGIAGLLRDERGVDPAIVRRMVEAQRHRGPDALGVATPDEYCVAGHARLSIVDVTEAANQPFVSADHVLSYNGEIYNHVELRPELTKLGAVFRGTSDTATLFEALRLFGVDKTLRRIRGMFAFAYYDLAERALYLCRDRLGIKPLHYVRRGDTLYFASEIKGLLAAVSLHLDPIRTIFSIASVADDSRDRTTFRGVRQVVPGSLLICRPGEDPEQRAYYLPSDDLDEAYYHELDRTPPMEIVRQFGGLMRRSVTSMLMADVPLGVFVSGGLDSSLIATLARQSTGALPLFSSDVIGQHSEIEDARLLARSINSPLHESAFEPANYLDIWARATWHYEYPIVRHPNAIPFNVVAGLARQRAVKVVLTGEGSDELFLGYPRLLTGRFNKLARRPVDALMSLYGRIPGLREYLWPEPGKHPNDVINLLAQDYQRQQIRVAAMPKLGFLPEDAAREHYLTLQMLQEGLHSLLHRNDRMGMCHSLEARFPFLGEEVVRFGINLPAKFKIHASRRFHNYKHPFLEDKWIVRAMARDLLPPALANKRKNGFPLAGYEAMRITAGFFANGYVADTLSLSRGTIEHVVREVRPKFVGRLAAVEIMGRLFDHAWSVDHTTAHVRAHVSMIS